MSTFTDHDRTLLVGIVIAGTEYLTLTTTSLTTTEVNLQNGTLSNPSLSFTSNLTTGLYLRSDGGIGSVIGGTERLTVTTSGIVVTGAITATTISASAITSNGFLTAVAYVQSSSASALTAAGTTQGTATLIGKQWNNFTTVTSGSGCILPNVTVGIEIGIWNNGANALLVYPQTGQTIDALAINTAYSLAAGASKRFLHIGTTNWFSS